MPAAELEPGIADALAALADGLQSCRDPWWVIGSAAMALHGAPVAVSDIDLLLSRRDAAAQLDMRGLPVLPGTADHRFRSAIFGRWHAGAHPVEMFAGFHVRTAQGWRELLPSSREPARLGKRILFVPSAAELIEWGRLFGRAKDAARETLLRALLP